MLVLMFKNIKDDPTEYSDLLITWMITALNTSVICEKYIYVHIFVLNIL